MTYQEAKNSRFTGKWGGGKKLDDFKTNFLNSINEDNIVELSFNNENKLHFKFEVPIITFETFKNYYGREEQGVEEASIRNMFNNSSIDGKLELCNNRLKDLLS